MIQGITCNCVQCELKTLFFKSVEGDALGQLCTTRYEKSFRKGDLILEEGHNINQFLYLKSGLVKVHRRLNEDRDQIIKIARPFDFVSLLSVFSDKIYHYSVTALVDSSVCYVDLDLIKNQVQINGPFALDLLSKMSETTDDLINNTLEISRKNLRGRIAYVLLYFARKVYNSKTFELPVSRKEIAEYIEMTTENVIRIMSEFRKDEIIRINGKLIEILDEEKLEQISDLG
jgi:CRP/FNR family transcriptional regulator